MCLSVGTFVPNVKLMVFRYPDIETLSIYCNCLLHLFEYKGWSGGAMVLGKLQVLGRPTNLD